jgi:anti-sigma regulatory factor (Ser/Thr protein kinase)
MSSAGAVRTGSEHPAATEPELASSAGAARQWPLSTHLELSALPTAPACARGHVRSVALEWHLEAVADTAELLTSEIVTNAIQAAGKLRTAEPPVIRMWVTCDEKSLVIRIWDAADDMPVRHEAAPDQIGGRGLMLVEALSKDWGAYRETEGKVVWVLISVPDDP